MKSSPEDKLNQIKEYFKFLNEIGVDFLDSCCEVGPRSWFLPQIEKAILNCQRCSLAQKRLKAVPGEGNWQAKLMFVGEAPGEEEDKQGRPFVGRAGQLLTKIIEAMNFKREEVFITNVVKCRPPENRLPRQEEIVKCSPYLEAQIRLINPKVIVALGKVAADFFIPGNLGMGQLRGNFFYYRGIPIMPTYHPAFVLRNEGRKEIKQQVWQDMKKVMALLSRQ
ncbi:MAG: uracil-DNA glycosylase [Candidatus Aminicenantes bacterium]|nr:uracil-DNA glycosylase [Candidatus Aminicenantes bacterium]